MPRIKDEAIVLRELDWSETSQVVVLLSREHGKVRGLAKGSKRQSPSHLERFSGGFELLTRGQVVATTRPTALATVTEWDLHADRFALRHDWRAQRVALYGASVAEAMLAEEDPHPTAFDALDQFLDQAAGERDAALLRYQWALLVTTGFVPELKADVRSGEALNGARGLSFDARAGGLTREQGPDIWRVREATVRALRDGDGEPDAMARANRLLCTYIRHLLDQQLPTMSYLLGE
jgi:DNA repair protein RecO (recombination protein O)